MLGGLQRGSIAGPGPAQAATRATLQRTLGRIISEFSNSLPAAVNLLQGVAARMEHLNLSDRLPEDALGLISNATSTEADGPSAGGDGGALRPGRGERG